MSYSVYQQITYPPDHTYKFLQLEPSVLEYIKNNKDGQLLIKSSPLDHDRSNGNHESRLVVCTEDKTWKLRQISHSNTVLLLNNMNVNGLGTSVEELVPQSESSENRFVGIAQGRYEYEITPATGKIDTFGLPVIKSSFTGPDTQSTVTLEQLLQDSPVSERQFYQQWFSVGGCEVGGNAYVLGVECTSEVIALVVTMLISQQFDYRTQQGSVDAVCREAHKQYHVDVGIVRAVLYRFSEVDGDNFRLNNAQIAQWFGVRTLARTRTVGHDDFLVQWKAALPEFYNVSLDIENLKGHFNRNGNMLRYVERELLSSNIAARFQQLFTVDQNWHYDDFIPFISEFVPASKKVDSVILKYAKKRRVGKSYVVSPRK